MYKEVVISVIIIIVIFVINFITQSYTNYSVDMVASKLDEVSEYLSNEAGTEAGEDTGSEKLKECMKSGRSAWNEVNEKMSYYLEHNELEKVDVELAVIESYIDTGTYAEVAASIEKEKCILDSLKEREQLRLINVF